MFFHILDTVVNLVLSILSPQDVITKVIAHAITHAINNNYLIYSRLNCYI